MVASPSPPVILPIDIGPRVVDYILNPRGFLPKASDGEGIGASEYGRSAVAESELRFAGAYQHCWSLGGIAVSESLTYRYDTLSAANVGHYWYVEMSRLLLGAPDNFHYLQ